MPQYEYVGNLHLHTPYSDGSGTHAEVASAAIRAGLDFLVVTDHNILVRDVSGYYGDAVSGYVLLLTGEEIHDRTRLPQVNHCLVYAVEEELCHLAQDPQQLINAVRRARGLSFLAHPFDTDIPWLDPEGDGIRIPWVDWHVEGYTGLEIWNFMSDWKATMPTVRRGVRSIFRPEDTMIAPRQTTLDYWDHLLAQGQKVIGIGNSDAHALDVHFGPVKQNVFPYEFLFNCVNTHILTDEALRGNAKADATLLYAGLRKGHSFIGYGVPGDPRGFRLSAHGDYGEGIMGDTLRLGAGVTLQIRLPERGYIKVIRHGRVLHEEASTTTLSYCAREPGAYRIEVWREFRGIPRCWILSNPVYVVA